MPRTRDGITCRLPLRPLAILLAIVLMLAAAGLVAAGYTCVGLSVLALAAAASLNEMGSRRIRVIFSKLLVEDDRWLTAWLIGPRRSRVGWDEVRSLKIENGALVAETAGAPFVTAQGASPDDLQALLEMAEAARIAAEKDAARA